MSNLDCSLIKTADKTKKYVEVGPICKSVSYPLSSSGKAIQVEGRRTGRMLHGVIENEFFWLPVSILRKVCDPIYGESLVAPSWFISKNDLWRHFN